MVFSTPHANTERIDNTSTDGLSDTTEARSRYAKKVSSGNHFEHRVPRPQRFIDRRSRKLSAYYVLMIFLTASINSLLFLVFFKIGRISPITSTSCF